MFCTVPSFEGLEKMLQIFALIDALMLATICSVLVSVDFEEIQKAMARYSHASDTSWSFCATPNRTGHVYAWYCSQVLMTNGYAKVSESDGLSFVGHPFAMIYGFPQFAIATISLFTMSLLGTFFLYMEGLHAHMATAPLPEPPATFVTEGRLLSHQKEKLPEEWWWFGGPVSFFIFASMASGIHGTLRLNTRVFTFIHVRSHVCFMHLSSIPLFQSPIQTASHSYSMWIHTRTVPTQKDILAHRRIDAHALACVFHAHTLAM
jgi:hypothetical protein